MFLCNITKLNIIKNIGNKNKYTSRIFEKENEIRAIIYKREKEAGLEVPFKFNLFIESIILNPLATAEQSDAIKQLADKYSVSTLVKSESSL